MSNIFRDFVLARPVKTPLKFGHNQNIVIESIDFGVRKKNGIKVNANTFIKLTKVDPENGRAVKASTEINFWDLDHTKEYVVNNLISQFTVLAGIVAALGGDIEAFESKVEGALGEDYEAEIRTAKGAKKIQKILVEAFEEEVKGKYGMDMDLLQCKLVSNNKGFMQPAVAPNWIVRMDDEEGLPEVTNQELKTYREALAKDKQETVKPDETGTKPSEGGETAVAKDSLSMI